MIEKPIKTCRICKQAKEANRDNFSPLASGKYGLAGICKPCNAETAKQYRLNNLEKVRAADRERNKRDERKARNRKRYKTSTDEAREKLRESNRRYKARKKAERQAYYDAHKAEIETEKTRVRTEAKRIQRQKRKEYYQAHREALVKYHRSYYHNHREEQIADKREWRKENTEESRRRVKTYQEAHPEVRRRCVENYRSTPRGKLSTRISNMIRDSIKRGKNGRHWECLVGYSLLELEEHLRKTVPDGYSWQDFLDAKLHIDHKIPIAAFNFKSPEDIDFKRCWALKNLQLLPAEVNILKGARLDRHFQPSLIFSPNV